MTKFIRCPYCNKPLPFVQYRTKKGKDGRVAKWAEYEKCPHSGDPYHTRMKYDEAGNRIDEAVKPKVLTEDNEAGPVVGGTDTIASRGIGPIGRLFLFEKESLTDILGTLTSRYPGETLTCKMSKEISERLEVKDGRKIVYNNTVLTFALDKSLTPGYGYITVERKINEQILQ